MSTANGNGEQRIEQHDDQMREAPRRGRPRGRKNRGFGNVPGIQPRDDYGTKLRITGRPKSLAAQRKWQRDWVMPQFVISRRQAHDMLLKYLRSKPGKAALTQVIEDGFVGLSKLPDNKLAEFLVSTNLLSRYPHEIVVRGA